MEKQIIPLKEQVTSPPAEEGRVVPPEIGNMPWYKSLWCGMFIFIINCVWVCMGISLLIYLTIVIKKPPAISLFKTVYASGLTKVVTVLISTPLLVLIVCEVIAIVFLFMGLKKEIRDLLMVYIALTVILTGLNVVGIVFLAVLIESWPIFTIWCCKILSNVLSLTTIIITKFVV